MISEDTVRALIDLEWALGFDPKQRNRQQSVPARIHWALSIADGRKGEPLVEQTAALLRHHVPKYATGGVVKNATPADDRANPPPSVRELRHKVKALADLVPRVSHGIERALETEASRIATTTWPTADGRTRLLSIWITPGWVDDPAPAAKDLQTAYREEVIAGCNRKVDLSTLPELEPGQLIHVSGPDPVEHLAERLFLGYVRVTQSTEIDPEALAVKAFAVAEAFERIRVGRPKRSRASNAPADGAAALDLAAKLLTEEVSFGVPTEGDPKRRLLRDEMTLDHVATWLRALADDRRFWNGDAPREAQR